MWESIIDAIAQIFSKMHNSSTPQSSSSNTGNLDKVNLDQMFKNKEDEHIFAQVCINEWNKIKSTVEIPEEVSQDRRRMHHTRGSTGTKKPKNEFEYWLETAPTSEVKRFAMTVVHKYLTKRYKMSGSVLDRGNEVLMFAPLTQNQITRHKEMNQSQKWYYLTNERHSDYCIYRIRRRNISVDKLRTQMELRFIKGPDHSYMYYNTPMFIFAQMTLINLTYLTKNKYLAGAWNYFWYSCLNRKIVKNSQHASIHPGFAFFNEKGYTKKAKEQVKQAHLNRFKINKRRTTKHGKK